jgi:hypothetical protein
MTPSHRNSEALPDSATLQNKRRPNVERTSECVSVDKSWQDVAAGIGDASFLEGLSTAVAQLFDATE